MENSTGPGKASRICSTPGLAASPLQTGKLKLTVLMQWLLAHRLIVIPTGLCFYLGKHNSAGVNKSHVAWVCVNQLA